MKSELQVLGALLAFPMAVQAVEIASESMRVTLDEARLGAVTRIVTSGGVELASAREQVPLFSVKATRTDDFTKSVAVTPDKDTRCTMTRDGNALRLVYTQLGEQVEKVTCTVRPDGRKLRWNVAVEPKAGWAVEETAYPRILTAEKIGTTGADDAVVTGGAKGGVWRNPMGRAKGCHERLTMPGSLACPFACHYDDHALFYIAAEDGRGHAKMLNVDTSAGGVEFRFVHTDFDTKPMTLGYDIVTAALDGTGKNPTVWQDAADLYRDWARRQGWCGKPLRDRDDLPKWLRDAPAMVRFGRDWLVEPDRIRKWMKDYWAATYPKAPLVTAFWGWERHGYWVSDYFPVFPSDERFAALVKDLRAIDAHAFPWPSGYYWVLDYDKKKDGSYRFTDYDAYQRANGDSHCCITRGGSPYRREPRWLNGGHSTCLCGGDPFTQAWWNKGVCLPLAKLGCEMIQVDQNVGGAFRPCWSRKHGHTPGDGLWKYDVFYRQLKTMRETMKSVQPDSVVCYEEPCEIYNDLIGIQDYRTCEARRDEWASVFNYVYHEWVPCFQSNPRRGDRIWKAHEAADGQMPHLTPLDRDVKGPSEALVNGDFERLSTGRQPFVGWERLSGYKGEKWNGRASVDLVTRHDGRSSLRLDCTLAEKFVQVAQNVDMTEAGGGKRRFRLSAWLKTGKASQANRISGCFLTSEHRSVGGIPSLMFPKPDDGWKLVSSEFSVARGASYLRIMNDVGGDSTHWVDSMRLEELLPDGGTKPVMIGGTSSYDRFMRNWVEAYHGRGRDWLAHGRQIRPPILTCETVPFSATFYGGAKVEGRRPAVFNSAWESLDGRRALVFVNSTHEDQKVAYRWNGRSASCVIPSDEIVINEVK